MKRNDILLFNVSEATGNLAASLYTLTIYFLMQRYIESQFINSLIGNLSSGLSLLVAFFVGGFVDRKSPKSIILWSDLILIPLFLIPTFLLNFSIPIFLVSVVLVDIVSVIVSELDSVARPVYLKLSTNKQTLVRVVSQTNVINSVFSISGYLLVLLTIQGSNIKQYFYLISLLYLISATCIYFLPKVPSNFIKNRNTSLPYLREMKEMLRYFLKNRLSLLYVLSIVFMIKNQIVMSLLIYRVGKVDETFSQLPLIGLGILISIGLGILWNRIIFSVKLRVRKLLCFILILLSGFLTILVGRISQVDSFILFGMTIGGIFGTGLPFFSLISSERLLATPNTFQGKALSLIRVSSILSTLILTIFIGFLESRLGITSLYFDMSGILSFILAFLFIFLSFVHLVDEKLG